MNINAYYCEKYIAHFEYFIFEFSIWLIFPPRMFSKGNKRTFATHDNC